MSYKAKREPKPEGPTPVPKTDFSQRYSDCKPAIDTGMTVAKLIEQMKKKLPKEAWGRWMRPERLAKLLSTYEGELRESDGPSRTPPPPLTSPSGVNFSPSPPRASAAQPTADQPFLLLDVNDPEDYEQCHIRFSKSYPKMRLCRATDALTRDIMAYQSVPEKMVIMYCQDGKLSVEAAQFFFDRGFNNVCVVVGGLIAFAEEVGGEWIVGDPPRAISKPDKKGPGPSDPSRAQPAPAGRLTRAAAAVKPAAGDRRPFK